MQELDHKQHGPSLPWFFTLRAYVTTWLDLGSQIHGWVNCLDE